MGKFLLVLIWGLLFVGGERETEREHELGWVGK